ncbi:fatty-acid amide hydrolase 1 isoform X1 [Ictalurus punctatus]|uniref:Fatty-acid amide hydrolase 1 n=1 Tax=Ictalurus punctatus TaxID=7998 RepID=A0A2D0RX13_ICTPU|nr:fatty-acid amide hydrolase 1 isoform X1 [Ictalurus punctatus]XP_017335040.1 fatty-acid amide hydrolase 1 isoform X1 [Ictalurus punctatus]XP_017335041.1 fatty-acid amide hydrolase 1 isoform X1 [Ictalurus punctatus]XP_017335044.1 fatty-acid amide hydrolase 1 isoform X1 [Ictalurus punctatus]
MDGEWTLVAVALLCGVSFFLLNWSRQKQNLKRKLQIARQKREAGLQQAEQAVSHFKAENPGLDFSPIVALPLSELSQKIREGSLQPDVVLHAYIEKALEVNSKLNCGTALLIESLKQLEDIETHKDGLLYGIPISIKDNFDYEGYDSTCGVFSKVDNPAVVDSVVVKVLKRQGAIPFIKTNIAQGLYNYECSNPIYGTTVNPNNLQKTSGGSTGGEGALIGGGGSILGLGGDLGGSIRIPASFCGICALKPTANRISSLGLNTCVKGRMSILSSVGPLARDVDSLALCMRALLNKDMFTLDPKIPPLPFKQEVYESSEHLRIGYYDNDGYMQPSPSMSRALQEAKSLLEQAGHMLVPFKPPRIYTAVHEYFLKNLLADGGATIHSHLKQGPIDPCLNYGIFPGLPRFVKKTISLVLRCNHPHIASLVDSICGVSSVADLWEQQSDIENYIHEVIEQWKKLELDVLLCPMLGPALNLTYSGRLTSGVSYTALYNLLNFPVGVIPITKVTAEDEDQLRHYKGTFGGFGDKLFIKAMQGSVGLPVAVQCVSLPWQDELCLRLMRELEALCAKNKKPNTQ